MKDLFDVQQLTQFEFGAIIITVLIAGLVFGCLIAYALLNRKNSPNAAAAVKIQEEFEEYKEKVDSHFNKTSEMFKDVTTQYKKLYDHMAVGAIELSNADTISMPRLEMQDTEQQTQDDSNKHTDELKSDEDSSEQAEAIIEQAPEQDNQAEQQTKQAAADAEQPAPDDNELVDNEQNGDQAPSEKTT